MARLFGLFSLLIALGSIFPFNFDLSRVNAQVWQDFIAPTSFAMGQGDLVGNIVLFLPFGFFGAFALPRRRGLVSTVVWLTVLGAIFGFALQVLQLALPTRVESIPDVLANTFGAFVSGLAGWLVRRGQTGVPKGSAQIAALPAVLLMCWLFYRLYPFIPSLDLQSFKDALKPLLLRPQVNPISVFNDAVSWFLAGVLLRQLNLDAAYDRNVWVVIGAVTALEVVIVQNSVHASGVLGAGIAAIIWPLVFARQAPKVMAGVVAALLSIKLLLSGLEPFELAGGMRSFSFLPFSGMLGGSMFVNTLAVIQKVFFYGGLFCLLRLAGAGKLSAVGFVMVLTALIECLQVFFTNHTPEITDPFLVALIAYGLVQLDGRNLRHLVSDVRSPLPS